jgi:hypothetical protein
MPIAFSNIEMTKTFSPRRFRSEDMSTQPGGGGKRKGLAATLVCGSGGAGASCGGNVVMSGPSRPLAVLVRTALAELARAA